MAKGRQDDEKERGNDGTTLDLMVEEREALPPGLSRLRSGMIAVTQLFCPNGHNLVSDASGARFNGYPGITLMVEGRTTRGLVIVSPIHGDDTKFGESDFEPGEVLKLTCPRCGVPFPVVQPCGCTEGSNLVGFFLDEAREPGNQVAVCTAWGCLRSRITDRFQVISRYE
ncbi:MAG: hypothetical protein PHU25_12345 [Deltaproteobacteria bacterium]|nr:hypothetical protein [Deltaproteobacteria bacterium]